MDIQNAERARRCFVTPQTMRSIVTRLEKAGLLRRTPDPDHGRFQQTHLTDEGSARLERAHVVVEEIERTMTAGIPPEELEQAKSVLVRCVATLTDESPRPLRPPLTSGRERRMERPVLRVRTHDPVDYVAREAPLHFGDCNPLSQPPTLPQ